MKTQTSDSKDLPFADESKVAQRSTLPPVVSFVGYSGSGKTTLVERIVRELSLRKWSVSVIKFTHHGFDLDRPGKDSYRFKQSEATSVGLVSPHGWAIVADGSLVFRDLLAKLPPSDLIITEGGSWLDTPKIEVFSPSDSNRKNTRSSAKDLVAFVGKDFSDKNLSCFDRDDISGIAGFLITNYIRKQHGVN